MRVAIVGLSQSKTSHLAQLSGDWQLWGLAWDPERHHMDRTFEMHEAVPEYLSYYRSDYLEDLALQADLWSADGIAGSTVYPFDEVAQTIGQAYWCSSMAYMLALAIHEGASEIALCGIDMSDEGAYAFQRPNMEYLIGVARGRGIKVSVPANSPLCKHANPPTFEYDGRYGRMKT